MYTYRINVHLVFLGGLFSMYILDAARGVHSGFQAASTLLLTGATRREYGWLDPEASTEMVLHSLIPYFRRTSLYWYQRAWSFLP